MKRRLFNLAAAVSLVIVATAMVGAVRSPYIWDTWSYQTVAKTSDGSSTITNTGLTSGGGSVVIGRDMVWGYEVMATPSVGWSYEQGKRTSSREPRFGQFALGNDRVANKYQTVGLSLPWWFVALAGSVLPAWWVLRRIKSHRQSKLGLCPTCGYDLRATPDRCPECGALPDKPLNLSSSSD